MHPRERLRRRLHHPRRRCSVRTARRTSRSRWRRHRRSLAAAAALRRPAATTVLGAATTAAVGTAGVAGRGAAAASAGVRRVPRRPHQRARDRVDGARHRLDLLARLDPRGDLRPRRTRARSSGRWARSPAAGWRSPVWSSVTSASRSSIATIAAAAIVGPTTATAAECALDRALLSSEERAYFEDEGHYTDVRGLEEAGYRAHDSDLHSVALNGDPSNATGYTIVNEDRCD